MIDATIRSGLNAQRRRPDGATERMPSITVLSRCAQWERGTVTEAWWRAIDRIHCTRTIRALGVVGSTHGGAMNGCGQ